MKKKSAKEQISERHVSRRQFLYGAGTTLALPTLVSMLPKALAQNMAAQQKLRLCFLPTLYGMNNEHLIGEAANHPKWEVLQSSPQIRHGLLSEIKGNISYVVDAKLDPYRNDLNLYNGLDLMSAYGHSTTGFAGSFTNGANDLPADGRSVDVIIENSAAFKQSFNGKVPTIRQRSYYFGGSFSFDRKRDVSGNFLSGADNCVQMPHTTNDGTLFRSIFDSSTQAPPTSLAISRRQLVVDNVLEDYRNLKNNRRISGSDKSLLDQFINSIFEIQKNIGLPSGPSCNSVNGYVDQNTSSFGELGDWNTYWKNVFSIVVAAFSCDQSRMFHGHFHAHNGPHHHSIDDSASEVYGSKYQKEWINLIVDHLIKPMKELQDPFGGGSMLDNSLVFWHNEHSGRGGHWHGSVPLMSFGKLGGNVKSGYIMDYNQGGPSPHGGQNRRGFPIKMLLVSLLESMGVTRSEILREGDSSGFASWPTALLNGKDFLMKDLYDLSYFGSRHNDPLPFLKKA